MDANNYLRQSGEPLYPNLLWNRPVSARHAGRLLLVGGQGGNFSMPNNIYLTATASGVGQCQIVFPDSLQKTLAPTGIGIFTPSNPSGSFGKSAVEVITQAATDFDAIGIGGDLGNNSQTTVALESLLNQLERPVALYDDALELLRYQPDLIARRPKRLVIASMNELFKLAGRLGVALPTIKDGGVTARIEVVQALAAATTADYAIFGREIIVASGGQISLTDLGYTPEPAVVYGLCMVFWLQNPKSPFQGLTTAAYILSQFNDDQIYTVPQATTQIRAIIDKF